MENKKPNVLHEPIERNVAIIFVGTVMGIVILFCGIGWVLEYGSRTIKLVWYLLLDYPRLSVVCVFSVVVGLLLLVVRGFSFRQGRKQ